MIKTFYQIFKVEFKVWSIVTLIILMVFGLVLLGGKAGELLGIWNIIDL